MEKTIQHNTQKTKYPVMILYFVLVFVAAMAIMVGYTKSNTNNVRSYAEFSLSQNTRRISGEIDSITEYAICSIREVSDMISKHFMKDDLESPKDIIDLVIENTPFRSIEYIDVNGINMTDAGEKFDASDREYFQEGIKGNTGIWINYEPKYSDEALINFYTPIYVDDKIAGVITGYLCGDQDIRPMLESTFFGNEIRGILCDENGVVITTTFGYPYGTMLEDLASTVGKNVTDREEYISNLQQVTERLSYYRDKYGEALASVCEVEDTHWYVIQIVPGKSLSMVVGAFSRKAYIAMGGVTILFVLIMFTLFIQNRRKLKIEKQYTEEIQIAKNVLEDERLAMEKIHETISSGSFKLVFDESGVIKNCIWSEEFRRLLGFRKEEDFPNTIDSIYTVISKEEATDIVTEFEAASKDETDQKIFDVEHKFMTRKDGMKWFEAAGRFTRNDEGKPIAFYGLLINRDDRKKNEEKLALEHKKLMNSLKEQMRLEDDAKKQQFQIEEQQKAYDVLCDTYEKILKVNLTKDSYSIVKATANEYEEQKGKLSLSGWMHDFAKSGGVHEEDKKEYLLKTDLTYLQNHFKKGNQSVYIHYRRRFEETYENALMEIVAAPTYSSENQEAYLYVKNVN